MNKFMKRFLFLLTFLFTFSTYSMTSWPEKRQLLHGDILSLSYVKDGKKWIKVAFLDADSNLRIAPSGKPSANSETDVQVLPCVGSRLKLLKEQGYLIAIASNQGGISSGKVTFEIANNALQETMRQVVQRNNDAFFHWYDFAENYSSFFGEDKKLNTYRKPGKGMALLLQDALNQYGINIDKEKSFMVGDSLFKKKIKELKPNGAQGIHFSHSDRCFAQNYGIRYFDPVDFFGWNSEPLFNTTFFDNAKNGFNIEFYQSYPESAKNGGTQETLFCEQLKPYQKYSFYINNDLPTSEWKAGYQCKDGSCMKAFSGNTSCPSLSAE